MSSNELLSTIEAAAHLGIAHSTFQLWLRQGLIPGAFKVGRSWVTPINALKNIKRPKMGRPAAKTKGR